MMERLVVNRREGLYVRGIICFHVVLETVMDICYHTTDL